MNAIINILGKDSLIEEHETFCSFLQAKYGTVPLIPQCEIYRIVIP